MQKIIPRNILAIRPDGIGDCLLITPALRLLKQHYPECKITVLIKEYTRAIFEANPDINEILIEEVAQKNGDFAAKVKDLGFDCSLHFMNEFPYAKLARDANIPHRIGYDSKILFARLYNHRTRQHCADLTRHIVEQHCGLLEIFGINYDCPPPLQLFPHPNGQQFADKLIKKIAPSRDDKLIYLHPGTNSGKAWLPDLYARVVNILSSAHTKILITGGPQDADLAQKILSRVQNKHQGINLAGKLSLQQSIALLSRAHLYIGGDTGPMHAAAALKIPCVAIFPSKLTKPTLLGPWMTKNIVLRNTKNCAKACIPSSCNLDYCTKSITPNDVIDAANKLLFGKEENNIQNSKNEWLRQSLNVLTNNEEVIKELSTGHYCAIKLDKANNVAKLIKSIIKEDINVIHWSGRSKPLFLKVAVLLASPSLSVPPLLIFDKNIKKASFKELIGLYIDGMKKR